MKERSQRRWNKLPLVRNKVEKNNELIKFQLGANHTQKIITPLDK
jgi:hypothetical protein